MISILVNFLFQAIVNGMAEIYEMPGHLIRRLQQISISVFSDRMKEVGMDITAPQFAVLSTLSKHENLDQATLAGMIAHDRATIGGVIERLIAKGLTERHTSPTDRRSKIVTLTAKGQEVYERMLPIVNEMQTQILPGLSADEREMFIRLAQKAADKGNDLSRAPLVRKSS